MGPKEEGQGRQRKTRGRSISKIRTTIKGVWGQATPRKAKEDQEAPKKKMTLLSKVFGANEVQGRPKKTREGQV